MSRAAPANRTGRKHEAEIAAVREMRARPTVSIVTGGAAFGLGRDGAYKAAAAGDLPVLRLGSELRIISAKALELLGLVPIAEPVPPSGEEP